MTYDLAVVGAGPAGLAAAVTAARAGLGVVLVDDGPRPGGQYYRHRPGDRGALHHGWAAFTSLRDRLDAVTYLPSHGVWHAEPGPVAVLHAVAGDRDGRPVLIRARAVVVATGAHDRSVPFPGWDLPGVITAGAAQALLKGGGTLAGSRVVVAGTGPFLLPVAAGLAGTGAAVPGVFEANRPPYGFAARLAGHPGRTVEAAGYAAALARHRVPYRTGHAVVEAHGRHAVEAVTVARLDRSGRAVARRRVACDTVAAGHGFTPRLDLALHLGCATAAGPDGALAVRVDAAQRSSVAGVYAAGETTGVGGAPLALVEGELAGLAAAADLAGHPPDRGRVRRLVARRTRLRAFAVALSHAFPVRDGWAERLRDGTVVCRCEEVTHGGLLEAVSLGATTAREVKLLSRAGMGWCQGRVCGYATARLTARVTGREPGAEDLRAQARRPLARPVRLADLVHEPDPHDPHGTSGTDGPFSTDGTDGGSDEHG